VILAAHLPWTLAVLHRLALSTLGAPGRALHRLAQTALAVPGRALQGLTLPRLLVVGTATLALGMVGGTASAYWSVGGTGSASATATTVLPLTVTVTPAGTLFPGTTLPASLSFDNPNPFDVLVTEVVPSAHVVSGGTLACTPATSDVVFATLTGSWTVPAAGTLTPPDVPAAVGMGPSSHDGCQGATFTVTLDVVAAGL
jgi:hypothetical protein